MQTFLPFASYAESAKVLDSTRLNSGINEALVLVKSLARVYELNRRGESGWENHTIAKMWKGCELQLARFGHALATEFLYRPLQGADKATRLSLRKVRLRLWTSLIEEMEDRDFPDSPPSLVGQEDFHSAFRALLLYKDIQNVTYKNWKKGLYPDHAVTRLLLPKKSSWKRDHYIAIWEYFGQPEPEWYGQWGWEEEPDDMKVFYSEDRIPQMEKEKQRKKDKPFLPFLRKKDGQDISNEGSRDESVI